TVMDLLPAPGGGLLVGAADPQLLWLDERGQLVARRGAVIPDYRDQGETFAVSSDAWRVRVGLRRGAEPVLLDFIAGRLQRSPRPPAELRPALIEAPGWDWQNWRDTPNPTLNGRRVELEPYESARSLALSPDGARAVLGCDWSLRAYDRAGKERWRQPVPSVVWAVAISGDGQSVVAAYGDGTLGWHRLADGERYLTAFIHAEDRRWIAWTPAGAYWGSPGAEELLGWCIDRGPERKPIFLPLLEATQAAAAERQQRSALSRGRETQAAAADRQRWRVRLVFGLVAAVALALGGLWIAQTAGRTRVPRDGVLDKVRADIEAQARRQGIEEAVDGIEPIEPLSSVLYSGQQATVRVRLRSGLQATVELRVGDTTVGYRVVQLEAPR
ncbi:MAG: hypothetical protein NZ552_03745, partial [Planctomycetes bacterium]|nr:hypothetical protein [Planctomycetota bacterium]